MRKGTVILATVSLAIAAVVLLPAFAANPGGRGSGEFEYDCGGSCHTVVSPAVIGMSAPSLAVAGGGTVTLTVSVSVEGVTGPMGVMIVSSLSPVPESLPSATGWAITSDPSGVTSYNYYETDSFAGSGSYQWTLTAPTADGVYPLYARIMHGVDDGSTAYAGDYSAGLSFIVGDIGTPTVPNVIITSPAGEEPVSGTISVGAAIISTNELDYAVLRIDGAVVETISMAPFAWSLDTTRYADGEHVLNITAVDVEANAGYKEITITVDNSSEKELFLGWMYTMAAGSVVIVAWMGVLIVVALSIRKRVMDSKEAK